VGALGQHTLPTLDVMADRPGGRGVGVGERQLEQEEDALFSFRNMIYLRVKAMRRLRVEDTDILGCDALAKS